MNEIIKSITTCKTMMELDELRLTIAEFLAQCSNVEDCEHVQKCFVRQKNRIRRNGGRLK